jgi:predicted metal-dependent peptidase
MSRKKAAGHSNPAQEHFEQGLAMAQRHPLLAPLASRVRIHRVAGNLCPGDGWAVVTSDGVIHPHPTRSGAPAEWAYVLAHCLLHLGFGHFDRANTHEWNDACDWFLLGFLRRVSIGRPPVNMQIAAEPPAATEERIEQALREQGLPAGWTGCGAAGLHADDMVHERARTRASRYRYSYGYSGRESTWQELFAEGLANAVAEAVVVASGGEIEPSGARRDKTPAARARDWFINRYPLLGALAASFKIVEDPQVCARLGISVAAVDPESREIFFNPALRASAGGRHYNPGVAFSEDEYRFVMAHELLHVGLRHDVRRQGRDPYLWNVAADYVINAWLIEMKIGAMPAIGALYDPELKGESAEAIYDRIVTDLRRYRRLMTMRGVGESDILERGQGEWWARGAGVDLDAFYRSCLAQGLSYHEASGRGYLPAGLVEEIRALAQPPIPWDVELARWFDHFFPPVERVRSYARPSRHQSATPDIPRPRWVPPPDWEMGRTFGVVLDTSGSMDRSLLAKALGAIASYSLARDVPAVRVVFCDAATYDQGYMRAEAIAEEVRVRGRGGTVLQPAIDLLERAEDFPKDGPILIITDGLCDRLAISPKREHAFLLPEGRSLPFVPRGPVFRIR